jgi:hypothetical protein
MTRSHSRAHRKLVNREPGAGKLEWNGMELGREEQWIRTWEGDDGGR